ncbi:MAG: DUF1206 domain-containing protein [Acidimicrobiales bacterium]
MANSVWVARLARLGFCARGVVYGVIGLIALQIARSGGSGDTSASRDGALHEIAQRQFGRVLLLVLATGLAGYALWRISEAAWGARDENDERKRSAKRILSAAKAALYLGFLVTTMRFVLKGPSAGGDRGDRQEKAATARFLELPAGPLLVGAVGLALVAGGGYMVYRGLSQKFEKRLDTSDMGKTMGVVVDVVGTVGLAARGLVFSLAGLVLVKAATEFDPAQARGIDGTLKLIAGQSYGGALLSIVAVGLLAYALYSLAEARYRRL